MNQRWTLHVENFARIKEADIEISPLMCFIGDNNSGKSYMMSLLWGIIANSYSIFYGLHNHCDKTEKCKCCTEWLSKNIGKTVTITDDVEKMYIDWFNELISKYKDSLLKNIFNYEIKAQKIEIRNFSRTEKLSVQIWDFNSGKFNRDKLTENQILLEIHSYEDTLESSNFILCWYLLMENLTRINESLMDRETPIYLPASRTGFLLTYPQIASKSIGAYYSLKNDNDKLQETLTAPYIQFLQLLIKMKNSTDELQDKNKDALVKFLDNEIVKGTVRAKKDGSVIRYQPDDMTDEIPMSITSSVVTEIATLLLLLKTRLPLRLIIIEEPEAHLHPALQKKIAQLLIRFVHSGVPIWITTHSDTILQHFNNMIKLNNRPEQERDELLEQFNYTKDDLLSPDEINLYQFTREDTHTTIKSLESGKYGFVVPSFNKAIDELMQEIFAFQGNE